MSPNIRDSDFARTNRLLIEMKLDVSRLDVSMELRVMNKLNSTLTIAEHESGGIERTPKLDNI
jgi:hypothetical protein